MADSIKKQIKAAIEAKLVALKQDGQFRDVRRKRNVLAIEGAIVPCCLFSFGNEVPGAEDTRGIENELPLLINVRCTEAQQDDLDALVVAAMGTDRQLGGLCVDITYDGDDPYVDTAVSEDGGVIKAYTIKYRSRVAQPSVGY